MKKTLIAVAALAATSAFAQATVYGRLDMGYQNNTTTNAAGTVDTKNNGFMGNGLSTSLWGIKGSEDLGGGMSANFKLEQDVNMANGQMGGQSDIAAGTDTSIGFTRTALVGVSGGFGSVDLGRTYTPLFSMAGASDVFGTTGATTVNLASADGVRSSSSIFYTSPNISGLQVKVSYGNNDKTKTDLSGDGKTSNMGASVAYAAGPLFVGFAIGSNKAEDDAGVSTADTDANALTATYAIGAAKIYAGLINSKDKLADTKKAEQNLGVSFGMGGGLTVMAAAGRNINTDAAGVDTTGTDMVLGLTKDLSKRTTVYVKTGTYNKLGDNAKQTTTALGLRHVF